MKLIKKLLIVVMSLSLLLVSLLSPAAMAEESTSHSHSDCCAVHSVESDAEIKGSSHDSTHNGYLRYQQLSDTPPSQGNKYHKVYCAYPAGCFYYDTQSHSFHYSGGLITCTLCGYEYTDLDKSLMIEKILSEQGGD